MICCFTKSRPFTTVEALRYSHLSVVIEDPKKLKSYNNSRHRMIVKARLLRSVARTGFG